MEGCHRQVTGWSIFLSFFYFSYFFYLFFQPYVFSLSLFPSTQSGSQFPSTQGVDSKDERGGRSLVFYLLVFIFFVFPFSLHHFRLQPVFIVCRYNLNFQP